MPRLRRAEQPTLTKSVYFYRAEAGQDVSGRPRPFDVQPALRTIKSLPFAADGRYLEIDADHAICAWPAEISRRSRLVLGTIRRRDLPQVEEAGRLSRLSIPGTSGLLEPAHLVFFPANIVGLVFNFYGPRMSRLSEYLAEKAPGDSSSVKFVPLLKQDVLEQLRRLGDVRVLRLRIRASFVETVRQANEDLGQAFDAALRAGQADEAEVILQMDGRSQRTLTDRLLSGIVKLARHRRTRSEAEKFIVRGLDEEIGRVETIDVLRDQFVVQKQIVRLDERSRSVDPESAFEAVIEAYGTIKEQLEAAAAAEASME